MDGGWSRTMPLDQELSMWRGRYIDGMTIVEGVIHGIIVRHYRVASDKADEFEANVLSVLSLGHKTTVLLPIALAEMEPGLPWKGLITVIDRTIELRNSLAHGTMVGSYTAPDLEYTLRQLRHSVKGERVKVRSLTVEDMESRAGFVFYDLVVVLMGVLSKHLGTTTGFDFAPELLDRTVQRGLALFPEK